MLVLLDGNEDYVEGPHSLTIPSGTASGDVCTDIEDIIIDDEILESMENFSIAIEEVNPCGSIGADTTTVVSITNNDSKESQIQLTHRVFELLTAYHHALCMLNCFDCCLYTSQYVVKKCCSCTFSCSSSDGCYRLHSGRRQPSQCLC